MKTNYVITNFEGHFVSGFRLGAGEPIFRWTEEYPSARAYTLKQAKSIVNEIGQGAKVISLSVERQLLSQADARAKALGISRAELVARGLRTMLARKPRKSQAA